MIVTDRPVWISVTSSLVFFPSKNAFPEDRYNRLRTFRETDSGGDSILQHRGLIYLFYEHTILRNPLKLVYCY